MIRSFGSYLSLLVLLTSCLNNEGIVVESRDDFSTRGLATRKLEVYDGWQAALTLELNFTPRSEISVTIKVIGGNATDGENFLAPPETWTFAVGQTQLKIPIETRRDFLSEQVERNIIFGITSNDTTVLDENVEVVIKKLRKGQVYNSYSRNFVTFEDANCLMTSSTVDCWGTNRYGIIGSSFTGSSPNPLPVANLDPDALVKMDGKFKTACVLGDDQKVSCWGESLHYMIDTVADPAVPVYYWVPTLKWDESEDIVDIFIGYNVGCVLHSNGNVSCWGDNNYKQVGTNSVSTEESTLQNVSTLNGVGIEKIEMGAFHVCALWNAGHLSCWGLNASGEIGTGVATATVGLPFYIDNTANPAVDLALGVQSTCSLHADNSIKCWGRNDRGQMGLDPGMNAQSLAKVNIAGIPGQILKIVAGYFYFCALTDSNEVYCWGDNTYGQLGANAPGDYSISPVKINGVDHAVELVSGPSHSCIVNNENEIFCWGYPGNYTFGNLIHTGGNWLDRPTEVNMPDLGSELIFDYGLNIAAGTACYKNNLGVLQCRGTNASRELGAGSAVAISSTPLNVLGLVGKNAIDVEVGIQSSCALTDDGEVLCWGSNLSGAIGNNGVTNIAATSMDPGDNPTGLNTGVSKIFSNGIHSFCALNQANELYCWGDGGGLCDVQLTPLKVSGTHQVQDVSMGTEHLCYLTNSKTFCLGSNNYGQFLNSKVDVACSNTQIEMALPEQPVEIGTGNGFTCARFANNKVGCVGRNDAGQLGRGYFSSRQLDFAYTNKIEDSVKLTVGNSFACTLSEPGEVKCWGRANNGEVAQGTTPLVGERYFEPTPIFGLHYGIKNIVNYHHGTCAQTNSDKILCWGGTDLGPALSDLPFKQIYPIPIMAVE